MKKMIILISLLILGGCSFFQDDKEVESEETSLKEGYYYHLEEVTTELFLTEIDAQEWMKYYLKDNQDKLDDIVAENAARGIINNVDLDLIQENEVQVKSCKEGLCKIYSNESPILKAFVVPAMKINEKTESAESEHLNNADREPVEDQFWQLINEHIEDTLKKSSELIELYQSGNPNKIDKESIESLYDSIHGRTQYLRLNLVPNDEEIEKQFNDLLMASEFLFNSFHQAQWYFEHEEERELKKLIKQETLLLREDFQEVTEKIQEYQGKIK
ncbi:hypothetical protein [Oceanobacillus sojae]|uniref:hypothetical protein n=1 Tax=Oceanobacillus sojae TaxID=582851 RepID=UPI003639FBCB